jgi:Ca2+-binding RTX toxin-like protein
MAIVNGASGDNILTGNDNEADIISGFEGNDWLRPKTHAVGGAADQCIGGTHTIADTIEVDASAETQGVDFSLTRVTSVSDRFNVIVSEVERMVYTGGSGSDIFRLAGAQGGIVNGGGGLGADTVVVDNSHLVTASTFTFASNMNLNGFQIFNMERVTLVSGSGDDKLIGGLSDDIFNGGQGNDTFVWTGGFDVYDGGLGVDLVDYSAVTSGGIALDLVNGRVRGPLGQRHAEKY